jgi:hypothetical protein
MPQCEEIPLIRLGKLGVRGDSDGHVTVPLATVDRDYESSMILGVISLPVLILDSCSATPTCHSVHSVVNQARGAAPRKPEIGSEYEIPICKTSYLLIALSSKRGAHDWQFASQLEHFPSGPRLCRKSAGPHPSPRMRTMPGMGRIPRWLRLAVARGMNKGKCSFLARSALIEEKPLPAGEMLKL